MPGGFTVPFSSSPPSTPDSRHSHKNTTFASHPSTTPAGPPPSSTHSFTPAGQPPPSSIFGSSQIGSGKQIFRSHHHLGNHPGSEPNNLSKLSGFEKPTGQSWSPHSTTGSLLKNSLARSDQRGRTFAIPDPSSSISLTASGNDVDGSDRGNEDIIERDDSFLSSASPKPSNFDNLSRLKDSTPYNPSIANGSHASPGNIDWAKSNFGSSVATGPSRSTKRLHDSTALFDESLRQIPPLKRQRKDSAIPGIIQNMSADLGTAKLLESDDLIIGSEASIGKIYPIEAAPERREKAIEDALPVATKEMCELWQVCRDEGAQDINMEDDVIIGIGPNEDAAPLQKATFIAPLLLQLHHPPPAAGKQAFASSKSFRASQLAARVDSFQPPPRATPMPKVLHDWLADYHDPYATAGIDLRIHTPNPTAHANYWDIVFNMLLRGKVSDVLQTLRNSDFQHARTARDEDGSKGYRDGVLKNITRVIGRLIKVLEECPTLRDDDWEISGTRWSNYRNRVEQALADLIAFAEGSSGEQKRAISEIEAPGFGLRNSTSTLGESVRKAERQIPLIVYENLLTMYGLLLGKTPEIVSSAQDWVEATVGLTVWWDGEDDDDENLAASFRQSRRSLRRSQHRGNRTVDMNPSAAYVRRLAAAFERVTDEDDPDLFQINSNKVVEVALASVFEGNVEGVIGILRSWSLPVASATVQIANLGGWLDLLAGPEKIAGFNQSDLMVLSYGRPDERLSSDDILVEYAEALFKKDTLKSKATAIRVEGWELSMQILARLDDEERGMKKLSKLLQQLQLTSDKRVDKLLELCQSFGLDQEASDIAEVWFFEVMSFCVFPANMLQRYANHFTNETDKYGNALIYYARARRPKKTKNVLDLLISLSVVESKAFPPSTALDDNLRALVENPKESLAALSDLDPEAAHLIHVQLTGYASLRRYYDMRDDNVGANGSQVVSLRPTTRRKAAAATLIAVINSAADNIHGGLYDEDRGSIVPVDGLLALLGEALVFVNQPLRELSLSQCLDLLKAIEDLQAVTSRVYDQCEECFRCTLANGETQHKPSEAREMLKKSISNMTSSSSAFSLIESSMESETRESTGSEGVMVHMVEDAANCAVSSSSDEVKRGWDWRKGLRKDASGAELIRKMRLGLAQDIARAWVEGEEA
ncbi:MAG: hypothetical protein Q9222_003883 [Ikaeria aurantiellina]